MGQQNDVSTSSTASSDPLVQKTLDKILGGVGKAYDAGAPPVFNSSLYSPAGATTTASWKSALDAAGNPDYAAGVGGAIKSFGNAAAGNDYGTNDPGYATLRAKAGNDALTSVNSVFNNSGRLGGGSNVKSAGEGVTNALAGLDYTNFQNDRQFQEQAAAALPGLYQSALLPSATVGSVGAAQDTNQQGILQGNYDLSQRQGNNQTDWLAKLTSILSGGAQTAGTTTTNTKPSTPWWQSILGAAAAFA
jgi:hypothetical protein